MPALQFLLAVARRSAFAGAAVLAALGLAFALRVAVGSYRSEALNFAPYRNDPLLDHPERTGIAGLGNVSFSGADGLRLAGWFVAPRNGATVILVHGTNADRASLLAETRILATGGFGALALDLPGNGASEGQVRWGPGECEAVRAAVGWAAARGDVDAQRIGGFGFSMGGYVLLQVAAGEPRLHALALAATPTGMLELARWEHRRWGLLSRGPAELALRESGMPLDEPRLRSLIAGIAPRPVLIFGGDADRTVPEAMTRELYAAAREPKTLWIVPGASHGNYTSAASGEYAARLIAFFSQALLD
jgi:dipeptidyl aminopeptidase/acylaminoacyl peptidase